MSHIFLCGFQGVGKSFYGALAAERLGRPFFDVDQELERTHGMSSRMLYAAAGEKKFRDCEEEVVRRLSRQNEALIALGGGSLERSIAVIGASGTLIYLFRPFEELFENLKKKPLPAYLETADDFRALFITRHALFQKRANQVLFLHQKNEAEIIEAICGK